MSVRVEVVENEKLDLYIDGARMTNCIAFTMGDVTIGDNEETIHVCGQAAVAAKTDEPGDLGVVGSCVLLIGHDEEADTGLPWADAFFNSPYYLEHGNRKTVRIDGRAEAVGDSKSTIYVKRHEDAKAATWTVDEKMKRVTIAWRAKRAHVDKTTIN